MCVCKGYSDGWFMGKLGGALTGGFCTFGANVYTIQMANSFLVLLWKPFCPSRLLRGSQEGPRGLGTTFGKLPCSSVDATAPRIVLGIHPYPPPPRMAPVLLHPPPSHLPPPVRAPCCALDAPRSSWATHQALLQILVPPCQYAPARGCLSWSLSPLSLSFQSCWV